MAQRKILTLGEAQDRLEALRRFAAESRDYEVLHGMETDLRNDVLLSISRAPNYWSLKDARKMAAIALQTGDIEFARHMA
jgi:hypothetical protein